MIRVVCMQVRVIALGCAADLLKENEAKKIAAGNSEFIPTLLDALKVRQLLVKRFLALLQAWTFVHAWAFDNLQCPQSPCT